MDNKKYLEKTLEVKIDRPFGRNIRNMDLYIQ